jgi:transcriptional regulator with XRE-family HTH domain
MINKKDKDAASMSEITLGKRLYELIKNSGLEQQQIAETLGIKKTTFNGYVKDARQPKIETLKIIADYFDVSVDYLTGHSDAKKSNYIHLPDSLISFVMDPENVPYIELAREMKVNKEHN